MSPQTPLQRSTIKEESQLVDFSSIIWYGANIDLLSSHLKERLTQLLKSYPEPDAATLRKMIASRQELTEEEVVVTNGPTAAFHLILRAFPKSRVLFPKPSLKALQHACELYDCPVSYLDYDQRVDDWNLEGVDICFLTTPNPPDGHILSHADMVRLFKKYPEVTFVVNQSYASFTTTNKFKPSHIKIYPNVMTIWSFSQPYGIPGLRIGYITATKVLAQALWRVYTPSVVTSEALEAAKYILIHPAQFTLPVRKWLRSAQELMTALRELDFFEVLPSDTTFFLLRVKKGCIESLCSYLHEKYGILVGRADLFVGVEKDCISITARSEEENKQLVEALRNWQSCIEEK